MLHLPTPLQAVLFDWDGTLADSVPVVTRATNEVLHRHGYGPVTDRDIHDGMRFPTGERMAHHMEASYADPGVRSLADRMAEAFYEAAERLGHGYVSLFPGVREMLVSLHERGMPMGLVTNNRGAIVRSLVAERDLVRYFAVIIAEEEVLQVKPSPEGVLRALRELGVSPEHALFVGDSLTDSQAAAAAAVAGVGAGWPQDSIVHHDNEVYEQVCGHPGELVDAIRRAEVVS